VFTRAHHSTLSFAKSIQPTSSHTLQVFLQLWCMDHLWDVAVHQMICSII
jgi:hypothetical protein